MEHPEKMCQSCGGPNPTWSADNELWNKVVGSPNGIICPTCFFQLAESKGVGIFGINIKINTMNSEKLINDKNFNVRLKASIERKLRSSGLWKMAVSGAKDHPETFGDAEKAFFESLSEIEIVEPVESHQ